MILSMFMKMYHSHCLSIIAYMLSQTVHEISIDNEDKTILVSKC